MDPIDLIAKSKEIDVFRDSYLRYCGYANEVGESFRPLVPKLFVHFSYAVAIFYVLTECGVKSRRIYNVRISMASNCSIDCYQIMIISDTRTTGWWIQARCKSGW